MPPFGACMRCCITKQSSGGPDTCVKATGEGRQAALAGSHMGTLTGRDPSGDGSGAAGSAGCSTKASK